MLHGRDVTSDSWTAKNHKNNLTVVRTICMKQSQKVTDPQSQRCSPIPQSSVVLQPVHRQIGTLIRVLGGQFLVDVHAVAG
jgi:hypothetical protein